MMNEEEYAAECESIMRQFGLDDYVKTAQRICAEYGLETPNPYDVRKVLQIERERAQCKGCKGLPCQKTAYDKGAYPAVTVYGDSVYTQYVTCGYQLAELKRKKEQREREKAKERQEASLKSARIPKRYLGKTLADYKMDKDNKDAIYYAQHSLELECGAYLFGECGCGKTFLAAIIAQMWLAADKSVIFIKVPALLDDLRATFNGEGKESAIYESMSRADLLILDDLGMEKPSRFAGTTLCKIIDDRYDNDAATIVTSNNALSVVEYDLNHAHDGENLNGSRIVDRLKQFCRPIKIKGGSRR